MSQKSTKESFMVGGAEGRQSKCQFAVQIGKDDYLKDVLFISVFWDKCMAHNWNSINVNFHGASIPIPASLTPISF